MSDICTDILAANPGTRLFLRFFTENRGWTLPALFSILRDLRDLAMDVCIALSLFYYGNLQSTIGRLPREIQWPEERMYGGLRKDDRKGLWSLHD